MSEHNWKNGTPGVWCSQCGIHYSENDGGDCQGQSPGREVLQRIEDAIEGHRAAAASVFKEGIPFDAAIMAINMILFEVWRIRDSLDPHPNRPE